MEPHLTDHASMSTVRMTHIVTMAASSHAVSCASWAQVCVLAYFLAVHGGGCNCMRLLQIFTALMLWWIMVQELKREGVLISPRMMADHMPDYLTAVLQRLAEKAGVEAYQGENLNGDYTIDIPPSPAASPLRGKGKRRSNDMQEILSSSLATGRAFTGSENSP